MIDGLLPYSPTTVPDRLVRAAFLTMSFVKTRQHARAAEELQQLGDLDADEFLQQTSRGILRCAEWCCCFMLCPAAWRSCRNQVAS